MADGACRRMSWFRERTPSVPILALTATATARMRADVITILRMRNVAVFTSPLHRHKLVYKVVAKPKKDVLSVMAARIVQCRFDKRLTINTGIVFCFSQDDCESVSSQVEVRNLRAPLADGPTCEPVRPSRQPLLRAAWSDAAARICCCVACSTAFMRTAGWCWPTACRISAGTLSRTTSKEAATTFSPRQHRRRWQRLRRCAALWRSRWPQRL